MNKCIFDKQRFVEPYDKTHKIGYINEEHLESYVPERDPGMNNAETPEPRDVYRYDEIIIESPDFSRNNLVNGLIRSRYSQTEEFAVLRHHALDADTYADEWKEFNEWVDKAKEEVDRWLNNLNL